MIFGYRHSILNATNQAAIEAVVSIKYRTVKGQNGEKFCEVKIALGHLCVNFEELEISLKLSTFFENKRYF